MAFTAEVNADSDSIVKDCVVGYEPSHNKYAETKVPIECVARYGQFEPDMYSRQSIQIDCVPG